MDTYNFLCVHIVYVQFIHCNYSILPHTVSLPVRFTCIVFLILQRGAFPLRPTENGLIFLPLNYELPISYQLQQVDAILHKATDEIVAVEMVSSAEFANQITFTRNMEQLKR